jgi:uncharacterized protein YfiM (DUF2279 family)
MTRLLAALAGMLLIVMLAAGGLLIAALDSKPLVERSETISPMAVASARWLLKSNDPRRLQSGDARRAAIPAALIDEGINYLASRNLHGRGALVLAEETAEIRLTLRPPIFNGYINLRANLREASGEPHLTSASIGTLPLPPWLVELVLHNAIRLAGFEHEWQLAKRALRSLEFDPSRQRVIVSYVWEPALLDRARNIAVSPQDVARIRSAHENLAGLLDHKAPGSRVPLVEVLKPMLDIGGDDQYANRRAAILALAAYLSEKNLAHVIPEAQNWPRLRPVLLTLLGRGDSAQHFAVSAALAAWAGEPIADAIGVYKELLDARHGSGFSFADLAADRAGTRFGQLLTNLPGRIDRLLASDFADQALVPMLNDLPESIPEREFRRRFGAPGSPGYQKINDEIERRLNDLPLYQ